MKKWQSILKAHHDINVINDTKAIVKDVIHDTINKTVHDDIITKTEDGYVDSLGNEYDSIYEYLGY